ncbi:white collar 2 protein [Coprinopsis sp. MPI-PUGE-AT-0042]|nr:white collar 2 protein [Coprinopsis sp. MPI-PUGE-AT-0042]
MTASAPPVAQSTAPLPKPSVTPLFDFLKRKRWADLLIAELYDTMGFVVTPSTKVIYCRCAGMGDQFGWSENDFIDCELTDFINPEDHDHFLNDLRHSLMFGVEKTTHARIRPKQLSSMLMPLEETTYEFRVHTQSHIEDPNVKVLVLNAKQAFYRSSNLLADQISDLKAENRRLFEHAEELRTKVAADPAAAERITILTAGDPNNSIYSSSNLTSKSTDLPEGRGGRNGGDVGNHAPPHSNSVPDDEPEEGPKKKKLKKVHGSEKYVCVTCGRTDSPEWRKGPLGPKTLCNACGLRWAKQVKKTEETMEVTPKDASTNPHTTRKTPTP